MSGSIAPTLPHVASFEPLMAGVELAAAGWDFCVVYKDRRLYGMGSNKYGQLGHAPSTVVSEWTPITLPTTQNITGISAGLRHVLAWTKDGELYAWGCPRHGKLGRMDESWRPQRVEISGKVVEAACGRDSSVVLTEEGDVLVIGSTRHIGTVVLPGPAQRVMCGWSFICVWLVDGTLHLLGKLTHLIPDNVPTYILDLPSGEVIEDVACGSEHVLVCCTNGNVYARGWNEHGNCTTTQQHVKTWQRVHDVQATRVWAGCATSFVL
jgi:alpha-tubulin suppressor-like RCC1 family protein